MTEERYLSIPEFAKLIGVSRIAVYKQVKAGKIKAIRIGRNYVIDEKAVNAVLKTKVSDERQAKIKKAVKRTVSEYGDVLRKLGRE